MEKRYDKALLYIADGWLYSGVELIRRDTPESSPILAGKDELDRFFAQFFDVNNSRTVAQYIFNRIVDLDKAAIEAIRRIPRKEVIFEIRAILGKIPPYYDELVAHLKEYPLYGCYPMSRDEIELALLEVEERLG